MKAKLNVVRTRAHLDCEPALAWDKVCFYEHIEL